MANLMKLHRKIKHNEKVCRAQDLGFLRLRSRLQSGQRSKVCISNNSKTTEVNLTILHRKIEHNEKVCCAQEHNEKVCCAQELRFYAQGQGNKVNVTIRSDVKLRLKSGLDNN